MGADQHLTLVTLYSPRRAFEARISTEDVKFKANNKKTIRNRHLGLKDSSKNGKFLLAQCSLRWQRRVLREAREETKQSAKMRMAIH